MEKIFIDTSALFALLAEEDSQHDTAVEVWGNLVEQQIVFFSNNYVLVEGMALIQNRLGLEFVHHMQSSIVPFVSLDWIDEECHQSIIDRLFVTNRRSVSMVDHSAFETMRRLDIQTVFTFDPHFREQGFSVIP